MRSGVNAKEGDCQKKIPDNTWLVNGARSFAALRMTPLFRDPMGVSDAPMFFWPMLTVDFSPVRKNELNGYTSRMRRSPVRPIPMPAMSLFGPESRGMAAPPIFTEVTCWATKP
jgi:hypothetical protein